MFTALIQRIPSNLKPFVGSFLVGLGISVFQSKVLDLTEQAERIEDGIRDRSEFLAVLDQVAAAEPPPEVTS